MRKSFSGWHMAGILFGGFAVVVAVNLLMASLAVGSFGGVVVENSYVASQKFNGWLAASAAENQLGWKASIRRNGDGYLEVATEGAPGPWPCIRSARPTRCAGSSCQTNGVALSAPMHFPKAVGWSG